MTAVSIPGLVAIIGLYWMVLAHFWGEFFGNVRRGPVTLRARDLERLRTELEARPRLAEALGLSPR